MFNYVIIHIFRVIWVSPCSRLFFCLSLRGNDEQCVHRISTREVAGLASRRHVALAAGARALTTIAWHGEWVGVHACVDRGPKQPAVRRAVSLITYVLSPPSARNSQWSRSSGLVSAVRCWVVYAVCGEGPLPTPAPRRAGKLLAVHNGHE